MKHLRTLDDVLPDQVNEIFELAATLKSQQQQGRCAALLPQRVLTMIFEKPSLRTRNSFEAAMIHLGGSGIFLSTKEVGLDGREELTDVANVLGSYSDVIVMRTFSQQLIDNFAEHADCPVVNGLSDDRHPCQALTDLFTIQEVVGSFENKKLVYIGDGNNVATSLVVASAMQGLAITVCTPEGFELKQQFVQQHRDQYPQCDLTLCTDPKTAVENADIIYTDVWASMGQEAEAKARKAIFAPYHINSELMALAPADCQFMHCLPAHRGEEVSRDVMDGPQSIVFHQAENRMHLARGLLAWLLQ